MNSSSHSLFGNWVAIQDLRLRFNECTEEGIFVRFKGIFSNGTVGTGEMDLKG